MVNQEELIDKIITQNSINTTENELVLKVVNSYENKKGKTQLILEVDPNTYSLILKKGHLNIGWRMYRIMEHINVIQCFRCCKFGHIAKNCHSPNDVCVNCADSHKSESCKSQNIICANCKHAVEVLKIPNIDYNHKANDKMCSAYKRIYEQLQEKINYPEIYNLQTK